MNVYDIYKVQITDWSADKAQFEKDHPNYCKTCRGWGMVGSQIMDRDTGIPDWEPCPVCADAGKCPWCGADALPASDRDVWCCSNPDCIWTDNSEGIPEPPEDPAIYEF